MFCFFRSQNNANSSTTIKTKMDIVSSCVDIFLNISKSGEHNLNWVILAKLSSFAIILTDYHPGKLNMRRKKKSSKGKINLFFDRIATW